MQAAGHVFRIFADQNGDRVSVGGDLCLERFDVRLQGFDLTLGKQHIQFIGQPTVKAGLREIKHLPRRFDVAVEDLQTVLARAKVEIKAGDVGCYHHIDPVARFLQCLGRVDLRLDAACNLAENVDFPLGIEAADAADLLQARVVVAGAPGWRPPPPGFVGARAGAAADTAIDLRKLLRAEHNQLQPRLLPWRSSAILRSRLFWIARSTSSLS